MLQNAYTWTKLMAEQIKGGQGREALKLYYKMREEGVIPNHHIFVSAMKACSTIADLETGKQIHAHLNSSGQAKTYVTNTLVGMYAKCGSIDDARQVFDHMSYRDVVSWNAMISAYAHMKMGDLGLELYARMEREGFTPDDRTFVAALNACATMAAQEGGKAANYLQQGRAIHAAVAKRGLESDIFVANTLVDMYTKCGSIDDARHVFEEMKHRDMISWNAIIIGYVQMGMGAMAWDLYRRMRNEGFALTVFTSVAALKACSSLAAQEEGKLVGGMLLKISALEHGRAVHAEIAERGFESDMFVANTLVDMYAKCGSMENANQVFQNMSHRDIVSWNAMIAGYAQMEMGESALELYACMQNEGLTPDGRTFVAALKACASMAVQGDKAVDNKLVKRPYLEQGRAIHAEVVKRRFESDIFVANTLVDMYTKCGSIKDARQVFENLKHRDVVTWNAMITGYAQKEMGVLALELYTRMQHEGFTPDDRTFVAALQACASLAAQEGKGSDKLLKTSSLEYGRAVHAEVVKRRFESDIFIANTLVDMYAKCGSIEDARQVFEKMSHRAVVSWNAIIIGYAQMEMGAIALELYARMQYEGFTPDDRTFVSVLKACACLASQARKGADNELLKKCLEQGRSIHGEVVKRGFASDIFVASALVDMYAKCGSIEDARLVFEKMRHRDEVSWNAMITGYAQMEMGVLALELYARMPHEGITPDARTFVAALQACTSLAAEDQCKGAYGQVLKANSLTRGRTIHAEIAKRGFDSDIFVANSLVDMYAKCGSIEDACQVFEMMRHRDVVSWNAMITGFVQTEMGEFALKLYVRMHQEGVTPDARTFVAVLQACSSLATQEKGKRADEHLKTSSMEYGRAIHAEVSKRGFESDIFVANTMVDMYAKCGCIKDAHEVFENMRHRDVVSWNAIITGYAQMDMGNIALKLLARMRQEGFAANALTFVAALQACGRLPSLEAGKEIHTQICNVGMQGEPLIANCLIDMYSKCGSMWEAQHFFDALRIKNLVTWNTLMAGYSGQGDSQSVFDLYDRMQKEGIKPDEITFVSVLNVCCHDGLVDKGQLYFKTMCIKYDILPSGNHYTCMADMLGRGGKLDEAAAMVTKMPLEPEMVTWMTILSACRKWNNAKTGRNTFECVVMLDEKFAAAYIMMTNICVSSQMWEESAKIEEMRVKARAWKKPGEWSWTDSAGMVHTILVEETIP